MTSAASEPRLSVVVPCVYGFPYIGACLDALRQRCPDAEIVVADATDEATRTRISEGWPEVSLLPFPMSTPIPELRAAGIAHAHAPAVAVIEDHCIVTDEWYDGILAAHAQGHPVVGGPVRNVATGRIRDWAAFLCEYSANVEPMAGGAVAALPGMNVSYDRSAVEAMDEVLRRGVWETWLHEDLQRRGFQLYRDPKMVVEHAKGFGFLEFLGQRFHYSRGYAGLRNPDLGWMRAIYFLGSPLLVPLVASRTIRNVRARRRYGRELLLAAPLMVAYIAAYAVGEATGYLLGGGQSLRRVK